MPPHKSVSASSVALDQQQTLNMLGSTQIKTYFKYQRILISHEQTPSTIEII